MSSPIQSNSSMQHYEHVVLCKANSLDRKIISELYILLHAASCQKRSDCVSDIL